MYITNHLFLVVFNGFVSFHCLQYIRFAGACQYWGMAEKQRTQIEHLSLRTSPVRRMSLRTSAHAGVAIPRSFQKPTSERKGSPLCFAGSILTLGGDCHTSDIGHWFAMTYFYRKTKEIPGSGCCRGLGFDAFSFRTDRITSYRASSWSGSRYRPGRLRRPPGLPQRP